MNEHEKHIKRRMLVFNCPECEPFITEQLRRTRSVHVIGSKVKGVEK
jgi:hypothetical protein